MLPPYTISGAVRKCRKVGQGGNNLNVTPVHVVVPPMPIPITYSVRFASYRATSEDRALVLSLENRLVVLLADGAGGIVNGGDAADVVVNLVTQRAAELVEVEGCVELLREADAKVMKTGGETTAVVVVVHEGGLYGASAGDSEAWLISEGGTVDDLTQNQHLKRREGSGRAVPVGFERVGR
jgi:serine/threonine protein phosphatase PrpC